MTPTELADRIELADYFDDTLKTDGWHSCALDYKDRKLIAAALRAAVPAGGVVVPLEPTLLQINSGRESYGTSQLRNRNMRIILIYRAMLSARPKEGT